MNRWKYANAGEAKAADLAQRREAQARYRVTHKGLVTAARYNRSEKGHIASAGNKARRGPERIERERLRQIERIAERPDQHRAQQALNLAVKGGRVAKPSTCQDCGVRPRRLHGHHHRGYAVEHRLDVIWLCPACHKAAHREGVV